MMTELGWRERGRDRERGRRRREVGREREGEKGGDDVKPDIEVCLSRVYYCTVLYMYKVLLLYI